MAIQTTCIGAYPKPGYITTGNWSESDQQDGESRAFTYTNDFADQVPDKLLDQATAEAIRDQVNCGIDIPTDGEQRRENYIHYHCRHIDGFDFVNLTEKVHRNGAAVAPLPTIHSKLSARSGHFLDRDFRVAQSHCEQPVKITVPGPLTIIDTTADAYYDDEKKLAFDLADALNVEIRALASAGCRYIQVDEPLFARKVEQALDYGVECLDRCFHGVSDDVVRVMHMCCGYPGHLDDEDYLKADPSSYFDLSIAVDDSSVDQVSMEDAHCMNDLSLLERYKTTSVILGVVTVASSEVETVDQIRARLDQAMDHIDQRRLLAAPDCGVIMLGRALALQKLSNMCAAAALAGSV
ncbi:MAG: cobalamin-independent methionine synthase II family protein [Pseudomonadota bacterium]